MPPALFFFLRMLVSSVFFVVPFILGLFVLILLKVMGDLIGIALNLWIALSILAILTVLVLLIYEHGISFHFLELPSVL